jgi:hypothetical protein
MSGHYWDTSSFLYKSIVWSQDGEDFKVRSRNGVTYYCIDTGETTVRGDKVKCLYDIYYSLTERDEDMKLLGRDTELMCFEIIANYIDSRNEENALDELGREDEQCEDDADGQLQEALQKGKIIEIDGEYVESKYL